YFDVNICLSSCSGLSRDLHSFPTRRSSDLGYFEVTNPIPQFTKAGFLQTKGQRTPVFVRFSTVQGSRGSTDLPRDVRGFAVKFRSEEHTSELQSRENLVCRLLLEKKKTTAG